MDRKFLSTAEMSDCEDDYTLKLLQKEMIKCERS